MASTSSKAASLNYIPLAKLQYNTKVDVYGVVKFVKQPYKTRGSDYCMMLSLVDSSFTDPEEKLKCLLFAKDTSQLPVANVGDIVRFHRLKVSGFKGSQQGQSAPGWSWLIFSGETTRDTAGGTTDGIQPLRASSASYSLSDVDTQMVLKLRQWCNNRTGLKQQLVTFHDVVLGCYFDMVCQVVSTWLADDTCRVLRVWDGTQCMCQMRSLDNSSERDEMQSDETLSHKAQGFMYDVLVFDDHLAAADKVKPADYVNFVNLHAAPWKTDDHKTEGQETVELVLHRGSSFGRCVKVLQTDNADVSALKSRLEIVSASISLLGQTGGSQSSCSQVSNSSDTQRGTRQVKNSSDKQPGTSQVTNISPDQPGTSGVKNNGQSQPGTTMNDKDVHCSRKRDLNGDLKCSRDPNNVLGSLTVEGEKGNKGVDNEESGAVEGQEDQSGSRCMLQTATVVVNHPHIDVSTIKSVLDRAVPCMVRVCAQVYDYHPKPSSVGTFIKMYCPVCHFLCPYSDVESKKQNESESLQPGSTYRGVVHYVCPQCSKQRDGSSGPDSPPNLQYTFMLRFLLKDRTEMLMANVWQKDAVQLLQDIEPEDILCSRTPLSAVQSLMDRLCQAGVSLDSRPWLECCLKGYSNHEGTGYQIFDTTCV